MTENVEIANEKNAKRERAMVYSKEDFAKLIINDLSQSESGRKFLRKYKQSEVRDIVEHYQTERNQERLNEISRLLWAKSPQYQRLLNYFADMAVFAHTITPIKNLKKLNKNKTLKQYVEIGELLKLMSLKHEMTKVLNVAFREDVFFGYIHRSNNSFFIQQIPFDICKITSIEDGCLNYSVDMYYFSKNESTLYKWADEIQQKYKQWKALKEKNPNLSEWVELDAKNTICIKINEDVTEVFPPFAGAFDAIFDIEAFKDLRKDKERLGNYMLLAQKLPMRTDSDDNNDFLIDNDFMMFFHNQASNTVPDNVGVITSPMEITPINFKQDTADRDGVAKATRDFWESSGTSQTIFASENTTSTGAGLSIKSDEEMVFSVLNQIERWINRYLRMEYDDDLMFNVSILPVTIFNQDTIYKMYLEAGQYGIPVKSHLSAVVGLEPIEVMNMAYLENDLLKMHEEWVPLVSSHTQSANDSMSKLDETGGAPKKDDDKISDETVKIRDRQ